MTNLYNMTVALHNLGCKVNYYETEKIKNRLIEAGCDIVDFDEKADIYVINTCSVTAIADKKSRQMIHRAKTSNPDGIVIAAGCYVQQDFTPEELGCDIIIGNDEKNDIAEKILKFKDEHSIYRHDINDRDEEYEEMYAPNLSDTHSHTRAFVKIQDGCDEFCSYCIIPYVRGRSRSRAAVSIIEEINSLVEAGCNEVVLTGIHLSTYEDKEKADYTFIDLCEEIDKNTRLKRLRISSLEPRTVTEDFVKRLSELECICPHFHLSLQSGSDTVIKRMNRKYTTDDFKDGVELLRKYFDMPGITTDIIVGFPNESDEEFEQTYSFAEEIGFSDLHVFPYSKREGTPAAKQGGQLTNKIKHKRSERLIALGERMSEAFKNDWKGREAEVLFEERSEKDGKSGWYGFTREYIRVFCESDGNLKNQLKKVTL